MHAQLNYKVLMQIKELQLHCQNLALQLLFYRDTLQLPIVEQEAEQFTVQIGSSRLCFVQSTTPCYYHFAINIASFQAAAALHWLEERVELLPYKGNQLVDFKNWQALAMYFYDPAQNIVEFIARRNLELEHQGPFSPQALFHLSEIGLPTEDVAACCQQLQSQLQLPHFDGDLQRFAAMGTEEGLFIIVDQKEKTWIPPEDAALPFPFRLRAQQADGTSFEVLYQKQQDRWQLQLQKA